MENWMRRVVITGMGAITPIGIGVDNFWTSVRAGKHGIGDITQFDTTDAKVKIAAEVKGFDPTIEMDVKESKRTARFAQMGIAAAAEAVRDAGGFEGIDPEKIGVIVGSGIGGISVYEEETIKTYDGRANRVSPLMVPMMIPNILPGQVAIKFGAKAVCTCPVTACATGTNAIGDAFYTIQRGECDVVIAGGAESTITPVTFAGFANMTALSTKNEPDSSSIPFDKNRDGFVMGEGAGIFILEELEHAKKRGAKIHAELVGYGTTCDAHHITAPSPDGDGAARAMRMAMDMAGVSGSDISYVNAHGTGTPANDLCETLSIKTALGEHAYNIPVNSTKSMIGHLLGGAGAVEGIVCVKSIQDGFVHKTLGFSTKDEELDLDYCHDGSKELDIEYVLSNSLGFGGHNATLLFKKY
jgi:3-oxoacyl-[acyl-carrier-protein] synthase II